MKAITVNLILIISMIFAFVPSAVLAADAVSAAGESAGESAGQSAGVQQEPAAESEFGEVVSSDAGGAEGDAAGNPADGDSADETNTDDPTNTADPSKDIAGFKFTLSPKKFYYNATPQRPDVICDDLEEGVDYVVEYEPGYVGDEEQGATEPGNYSVYITGIGEYGGFKDLTYQIIDTQLSVNKKSITLNRKDTFQIKATVENPNGKTTYKSSNAKIASVSSTGKITAKAKGKSTITVKNGYAEEKVKVTVKDPRLNTTNTVLYVAGTKTLKARDVTGKVTYKSSKSTIASVSSSGKITAKKKGTCTITVRAKGVTLKCKVTVKNPRLSKSKLTVHSADKKKLKVIGGMGKITWRTSNEEVAEVTSAGAVKGKKAGKCTITATRGIITMKCKVTVPKNYEYYPRIPDFGAVYGKMPKYRTDDTDGTKVAYKACRKYYKKYKRLLKKKGFKRCKSCKVYGKSFKGFKVYKNSKSDVVAVKRSKCCVTIIYADYWDFHE